MARPRPAPGSVGTGTQKEADGWGRKTSRAARGPSCLRGEAIGKEGEKKGTTGKGRGKRRRNRLFWASTHYLENHSLYQLMFFSGLS